MLQFHSRVLENIYELQEALSERQFLLVLQSGIWTHCEFFHANVFHTSGEQDRQKALIYSVEQQDIECESQQFQGLFAYATVPCADFHHLSNLVQLEKSKARDCGFGGFVMGINISAPVWVRIHASLRWIITFFLLPLICMALLSASCTELQLLGCLWLAFYHKIRSSPILCRCMCLCLNECVCGSAVKHPW